MTNPAAVSGNVLFLRADNRVFRFSVREDILCLDPDRVKAASEAQADPVQILLPGDPGGAPLPLPPRFDETARIVWTVSGFTRTAVFSVLPGHPFVQVLLFTDGGYAAPEDPLVRVGLSSRHLRLTSVSLCDKTDRTDTLAVSSVQTLYPSDTFRTEGSLFFFDNTESPADSLVLAKDAPTASSSIGYDGWDALVRGTSSVTLCGSGADGTAPGECVELYGFTAGLAADPIRAYRSWYRDAVPGDGTLFVMSNTWGDRSRDEAVCEPFMLREIDRAAEIGCDIVQIDDGWQYGATSNSARAAVRGGGVWEGYYDDSPDFWKPDPERFPNGLEPVAAHAKERGIELGLWFSPDSSRDFANWRRDADTVLGLWRTYGVRVFKLDGVNIDTKLAEQRFRNLLHALTAESGGNLRFNLDITAQNRLGYLPEKERGTLFVENRYTDWGNYYPKNTLRNLMALSEYFPPKKFQFELLNVRRNLDKYGADPFAPGQYPIDWLFCSVMVSNPLVWMEMTRLPLEDVQKLSALVKIWRQHRDALYRGDAVPLGDPEDGKGVSGFRIGCGDGSGYLILLGGAAGPGNSVLPVSLPPRAEIELLAQNTEASLIPGENFLSVSMKNAAGYVFARFGKKED